VATLIPRKRGVDAFDEHARKLRHDLDAALVERQRIIDALVTAMWSADPSAPRTIRELTGEQGIIETTIANLTRAIASSDELRRSAAAVGASAAFEGLGLERAEAAKTMRRLWAQLESQAAALLATNAALVEAQERDQDLARRQGDARRDGGLSVDVTPSVVGIGLQRDLPAELGSARIALELALKGR